MKTAIINLSVFYLPFINNTIYLSFFNLDFHIAKEN